MKEGLEIYYFRFTNWRKLKKVKIKDLKVISAWNTDRKWQDKLRQ